MGFVDLSSALFGSHAASFNSGDDNDTTTTALHAHPHHKHVGEKDTSNDLIEGDSLVDPLDINGDGFIDRWEKHRD
jgi:hypothetical protein